MHRLPSCAIRVVIPELLPSHYTIAITSVMGLDFPFLFSKLKILKQGDWDELQSSQEEELPFSLWKTDDEWRDHIPTQHAAECKLSYHTHCCFSATE